MKLKNLFAGFAIIKKKKEIESFLNHTLNWACVSGSGGANIHLSFSVIVLRFFFFKQKVGKPFKRYLERIQGTQFEVEVFRLQRIESFPRKL